MDTLDIEEIKACSRLIVAAELAVKGFAFQRVYKEAFRNWEWAILDCAKRDLDIAIATHEVGCNH